jgi:hypothetical protein
VDERDRLQTMKGAPLVAPDSMVAGHQGTHRQVDVARIMYYVMYNMGDERYGNAHRQIG